MAAGFTPSSWWDAINPLRESWRVSTVVKGENEAETIRKPRDLPIPVMSISPLTFRRPIYYVVCLLDLFNNMQFRRSILPSITFIL